MNRRKFFFQTMAVSTTILLGSRVLSSCKKDDPVPVAKDFIDTAAIEKLNSAVLGAPTIAALPAELKTASESVTTLITAAEVETYSTVDLAPVIQFYKTNIIISADEKIKLQANDAVTLSTVISRMLKTPSFTTEASVSKSSDAVGNSSQLSAYSSDNQAGGSDLYAGNYYQCALDTQKFIQDNTIAQFEKISSLKSTGTKSASIIVSAAGLTPGEQKAIALLMVLALAQLHNLTKVMAKMREKLETLHIGG